MMINITILPDAIKKNGKCNITIPHYQDRHKVRFLRTGVEISPKDWSFIKKQPKPSKLSAGERRMLDDKINRYSLLLKYLEKNNINPSIKVVADLYYGKEDFKDSKTKLSFFEHIDDYINLKTGTVVSDVIKDYNALKRHLFEFQEHRQIPITFKSLDYNFYTEFIDYLAIHPQRKVKGPKGLTNNTIGKQIKNLKAFINDRVRRKLIAPIDLSAFKVMQEEVDHIYLNQDEINSIAELDCETEELEKIRDFFVIGCYTGLRFSDIIRLKPEYIKEGMIQLRQKKTEGKIVVPLRKPALEILEKYNYYAPQVSSYEFNREIKKLGSKARINDKIEVSRKKGSTKIKTTYPKFNLISSHTCRRSFCTNAYLEGIDVQLIMKISGHKSESAFKRYLKLSSLEAALKLKDAWGI